MFFALFKTIETNILMKNFILTFAFCLLSIFTFAQTDGISYQAVIIDNNPQEIPGVDIPANNLPNAKLDVRFSIRDEVDGIEYQEVHNTETDPFGMIHLMIGKGEPSPESPGQFNEIYWIDFKSLVVEIDMLDGNGFVEFSKQDLTYIPYVKHREIIATSTLDVDGATNLNSTLNVNNGSTTTLSGDLYVEGTAFFNDGIFENLIVNQNTQLNKLNVDGISHFNNTFHVNNNSTSNLSGILNVAGVSNLSNILNVAGTSNLNNDLNVAGISNLNSTLNVNNSSTSNLSGMLNVDGVSNLNNTLNVTNSSTSNLSGELNVEGTSNLNDNLNVLNQSETDLSGILKVDGESYLNNKVIIDATTLNPSEGNIASYPLLVEGSQQGIAIKLTPNNPSRSNNFLSFWGGNGQAKGRIEGNNGLTGIARDVVVATVGQIPGFDDIIDSGSDDGQGAPNVSANQYFNNDYAFGAYNLTADFVMSIIRFGVNAAAAAGLCLSGDCDDAIWSYMDMVLDGIQLGGYLTYNELNIGVAFESGGADYAEWLKKEDDKEIMTMGEVIGMKGGLISKKFENADRFMIVSQNPMISGAMPDPGEEYKYERIAFMGQVPVKVMGVVERGDYILPSGNGDGMGIAVSPKAMNIGDYKRIIGVAWSSSEGKELFSYINTAVGINNNDLVGEIEQMQNLLNQMQLALAQVNPDYSPTLFDTENHTTDIAGQYTKGKTLENQLISQFGNKPFSQIIKENKQVMMDNNFDFSLFPYLEEALDNPSKENLDRLVEYYTLVLDNMQKNYPQNRG